MATEKQDIKKTVSRVIDGVTKDLPNAVKENKGAAIGAVLGYFLADTVKKNEGLITAVLGGLVGHVIDEKKKKDVF